MLFFLSFPVLGYNYSNEAKQEGDNRGIYFD